MVASVDIFRIESGNLYWCETVATIETAKARIENLTLSSRGNYFIYDQKTGQRIPVMPRGTSAEMKHSSVESRNGPRVGMG
jgi:hypothetical protein